MPTQKLTPMAERLLIQIGRSLEQIVLDNAVANADGSGSEIGDDAIREAFGRVAEDGFDVLPARVVESEKRLRAYRAVG